jgi:hypothetical protein
MRLCVLRCPETDSRPYHNFGMRPILKKIAKIRFANPVRSTVP